MNLAAIVLAGGVGSRMRPLTDTCPKPLLPLADEPLVGYQLRRLALAGVRDVIVSTGYLAERFAPALGSGERWGVRLRFRAEGQPLGTGGAMRAAIELLPEAGRVVVLNGDLLSSHDLADQVAAAAHAPVCLHVRHVPDVGAYGQVVCDAGGRVTAFGEKTGSGPGLANAGTYVVDADVLRSLPCGASSWERDLLPSLIAEGADVRARRSRGYFRDVGDPAAYRRASVDAVTGVLPGVTPRPAGTYVARGAVIAPGAVVGAGSSIHDGATLEPGARVTESVVLDGARIGSDAEVVRCVVAAGATVGAGQVRRDEVVARILTHR